MDAQQIRKLRPKLRQFLKRFDDCFPRKDTRAHLPVYVSGQLSDLREKSVQPIDLSAGVPVRTLQGFLSQHAWDHDKARDRLQQIVRDEHAGPNSIAVFDETSDVKKGDKTPGVQRQWCGAVGKTENCIVTVHLAYASDDFHCLLDGELVLPEGWSEDRDRCREAGIPDDIGLPAQVQDRYGRALTFLGALRAPQPRCLNQSGLTSRSSYATGCCVRQGKVSGKSSRQSTEYRSPLRTGSRPTGMPFQTGAASDPLAGPSTRPVSPRQFRQ